MIKREIIDADYYASHEWSDMMDSVDRPDIMIDSIDVPEITVDSFESLPVQDEYRLRTQTVFSSSSYDSQKLTPHWIEQVFHKRECIKFTPAKGAPVEADPANQKCGCGRARSAHDRLALSEGRYMDANLFRLPDQQDTPQPTPETTSWSISKHTKSLPTDAFGTIDFQGGAHAHRAQYVRLGFDSDPAKIMELFERVWRIEPPKLVITVHGGIANFDMQAKLQRVFRKGLLKAAKTTGAWIITSGINSGVVRHVASALSEGAPYRSRNKIVTIGIAPWGLLKRKEAFVGSDITVPYHPQGFSPKGKLAVLNDRHSFFLLVDNGTVGRYGADIILRKRLEEYISQNLSIDKQRTSRSKGRHGHVPVVCIVLEGGTCTIRSVLDYVTNNPPVPVVVCDGSGRAADLLAFAQQYAVEEATGHGGNNPVVFPDGVKPQLMDLVQKVFNYTKENADKLILELGLCVRKKSLITVFRLGEDQTQDVDHAILTALLKGLHLSAHHQLMMALAWNRADIARSDIFVLGQDWSPGALELGMQEALLMDRVDFVKLLLENGVSMTRFLTIERLEDLYNTEKGPTHVLEYIVRDVVRNMGPGYRYTLPDIGLAIEKLMGSAYECPYRSSSFRKKYEKYKNKQKQKKAAKVGEVALNMDKIDTPEEGEQTPSEQPEPDFKYPFNELLLWAVLTKRQEMARLMWQHGEQATAKALVACKLYKAQAKEAADDYLEVEICDELRNYAEEFRKYSVELLNHCFRVDDDQTLQLLTYELTNWGGHTCLSLAVMSNNKEFLAHPCCQILLADLWHGGLRIRRNTNLKVVLGLLFPPSILFFEFKTREELMQQPQTAAEHADEKKDGDSGVFGSMSSFTSSRASSDEEEDDDIGRAAKGRARGLSRSPSSNSVNPLKKVLTKARSRRESRSLSTKLAVKVDTPQNGLAKHDQSMSVKGYSGRVASAAMLANPLLMAATNLGDKGQSLPVISDGRLSRRGGIGQRPNRPLKWQKRFYEFYVAPITTFWAFALSYAAFIVIFTYVCLVKTPPWPSPPEWFVIAYVLSLGLEQVRKLLMAEPKSLVQKVRVYAQNYWNWVTSSGVLMFFSAFILRLFPDTLPIGRVIYCTNGIWWYLKMLDVMQVHQKLGPYITMVGKMVLNMVHLCVILLVVMSTFGLVRQSITYPEEDWSWVLVRNVFYKPYFMLYGEVYAPEIATCGDDGYGCVPGHWVVPIVMTVFLLISNILLINFLIAVFNNIYMETQSVSHQIWKFQRYQQVMEYESSPFLPPPLTVFCHLYLIYKYCRRVGRKGKKGPADKNYALDYALKLFLEDEAVERLHDFEEDCMEDLSRQKDFEKFTDQEERIKRTADRAEFISMKLNDVVSRDNSVKSDLRGFEARMEKIEATQTLILETVRALALPPTPPSTETVQGSAETQAEQTATAKQIPIVFETKPKPALQRKSAGADMLLLDDIAEEHEWHRQRTEVIQPMHYQHPIAYMRRPRAPRFFISEADDSSHIQTPLTDSDPSQLNTRQVRSERCRSMPLHQSSLIPPSQKDRASTDPKEEEEHKEAVEHKTSLPSLPSQQTSMSPGDPRRFYRRSGEYTSITDRIAIDKMSRESVRTVSESGSEMSLGADASHLPVPLEDGTIEHPQSTLRRAKPAFLQRQNEMLIEFEETSSRITASLLEGRLHKQSVSVTAQDDLKDMGMDDLDIQDNEGFHQISECLINQSHASEPVLAQSARSNSLRVPGRSPSGHSPTPHSSLLNTPLTSPAAGTKAGLVFSFDHDDMEILEMVHLCVILLVIMSTFGLVRQSITNPEEDFSWILVRNIFYKPYFMLYGEVYAAEIATCGDEGYGCVPGHFVVPMVMTVFLLISNILLINFLIAVFNNIYNETQSVSHQIWKFQRYQQVMEYESSPFLPPPLTVFCHLYLIYKYCRRVTKRQRGKKGPNKNYALYDYALKLFLEDEAVERLHDFEEDCMEDLSRQKEFEKFTGQEERIKRTADRAEFISMKLNDVVSRDNSVKSDLRGFEARMEKIERTQALVLEAVRALTLQPTTPSTETGSVEAEHTAKPIASKPALQRKNAGGDMLLEEWNRRSDAVQYGSALDLEGSEEEDDF